VTMSSSLAAADAPPSAGESEAVLASLSQRLRDMKGHAPSLSAIAMKGEEKVRYGQAAYTSYNYDHACVYLTTTSSYYLAESAVSTGF